MTLILDETFGGVYLKTTTDEDGNNDMFAIGDIETLSYCRLANRLAKLGLSAHLGRAYEQLEGLQEVWAESFEGVTA